MQGWVKWGWFLGSSYWVIAAITSPTAGQYNHALAYTVFQGGKGLWEVVKGFPDLASLAVESYGQKAFGDSAYEMALKNCGNFTLEQYAQLRVTAPRTMTEAQIVLGETFCVTEGAQNYRFAPDYLPDRVLDIALDKDGEIETLLWVNPETEEVTEAIPVVQQTLGGEPPVALEVE